MSKRVNVFWTVGLMVAIYGNAFAAEETVTTRVENAELGLTIKGNQELPNVLYIVPWKKGPKNDISPIQGRIVDEVYGPVEMNVFQRRVNLFRQLNPQLQPEAKSEK